LTEIVDREEGGIGANKDAVRKALEAHPQRFVSCTGEEAKALGRRANAILWKLAQPSEPVKPVTDPPGHSETSLASGSPRREPEAASQSPTTEHSQAQRLEPDSRRSGCASHPGSPVNGCRYCRFASEGVAR